MTNSKLSNLGKVCLLLFASLLYPSMSAADTIILRTGKIIEAEETWIQGDMVQFYVNGLLVNIAREDILRIEKQTAMGESQTAEKDGHHPASASETSVSGKGDRAGSGTPAAPLSEHQTATGYHQPFPGESIGFRGLSWGTPLAEMKGLVPTGRSPVFRGITEYVRPYDVPKVGSADVEKIVYGYSRGRLFTITIWTSGYANFKALQAEAAAILGSGRTIHRQNEYTLWSSGVTNGMLVYYKSRGRGLLWMYSRKMESAL